MKEIVIKQSKLKLTLIFCAALIFTALSVLLFLSNVTISAYRIPIFNFLFGGVSHIAIGIIGIVLGGVITVYVSKELIKLKPILIISEKGFTALNEKFVSWECVEDISIKTFTAKYHYRGIPQKVKQTYVCVRIIEDLSDIIDEHYSSESQKNFDKTKLSTIEINFNSIKEKPQDVLKIMQNYLEMYRLCYKNPTT